MAPELTVLRDADDDKVPPDGDFETWVSSALRGQQAALAIRIVGEAESGALNQRYRGKNGPTNVLSFPSDIPEEVRQALPAPPIGDLVICAPLVAREAAEQAKPEPHHWAHLTVHGVLHLLGYDHEETAQAERMESLEKEVLAGLGIPDPYAARNP